MSTCLVLALHCGGVYAIERFDFQVVVSGNTLTWGDDTYGYMQVQDAQTWETVCEFQVYTRRAIAQGISSADNREQTACTLASGTYNVINHSTTQRIQHLKVGESDGVYTAPNREVLRSGELVRYDPYITLFADTLLRQSWAGSWAENPGDHGGLEHSVWTWGDFEYFSRLESISVRASVSDRNGNVFVGGTFTTADGKIVNSIARLNTATGTWSSLATGIDGVVNALVSDKGGDVFAGGRFSFAGDSPASNVARWNASTSSWERLADGVEGEVLALALSADGTLYASVAVPGLPYRCDSGFVVYWTPSSQTWTRLGEGMDCEIYALAVDSSGRVYAGGRFQAVGELAVRQLATWNTGNQTWEELGGGMDDRVSTLVIDHQDNLYAGGWFDRAGGIEVNHVAKWNLLDQRWEALGEGLYREWEEVPHMPLGDLVDTLAIGTDGSVYVGGHFEGAEGTASQNIVRWDPDTMSWFTMDSGVQALGGRVQAEVSTISAHDDGKVYVGGRFSMAGGDTVSTNFSRWNPDSELWEELGSGIDGRILALAEDSVGNVIIGGGFTTINGSIANNIARRNVTETGWEMINPETAGSFHPPDLNGTVLSMLINSKDDLYVGGSFTIAAENTDSIKDIARYSQESKQWEALGEGTNSPVKASALALGKDNDIFAIGYFQTEDNQLAKTVGRLNLSTGQWVAMSDGLPESPNTLTVDSVGNVLVAPYRTGRRPNGSESYLFANVYRWNRTAQSWETLGSSIDGSGQITRLVVDESDTIYITVSTRPSEFSPDSSAVLRWNPFTESWEQVGAAINNEISSLIVDRENTLVVGGQFTKIGGATINYLARWNANGGYWQPLSQELNGPVEALFARNAGGFYAAGDFSAAGDVAMPGLAVWTPEPTAAQVPELTLSNARWRQIGVPCDASSENTVAQIFGNDELGHYGADWLMWGYDPVAGEYARIDEQTEVSPGEGYWIFQRSGSTKKVDMPASCKTTATFDSCPNPNGCYEVPLFANSQASQYQMVGYPFASPGAVDEAYVVTDTTDCEQGCLIGSDEANQYLYPLFYNFDGTSYKQAGPGDNFTPWAGYWVIVRPAAANSNARLSFGQ